MSRVALPRISPGWVNLVGMTVVMVVALLLPGDWWPVLAADDGLQSRVYLVRMDGGLAQKLADDGLAVVALRLPGWYRVTGDRRRIELLGRPSAVEEEQVWEVIQANDQGRGLQYALDRLRWDEAMGLPGVLQASARIAVLDTGADLDHEDLASHLVDPESVMPGYTVEDRHGHGTHVSASAAAVTNNGRGIAGVCPSCVVHPIKVCTDGGSCPVGAVVDGLVLAAERGDQVVNISLGGFGFSQAMHDAIEAISARGLNVVAAAGNTAGSSPVYPCAMDGVLCVAAVDRQGRLADFSSWGSHVDAAAPGVDVLSAWRDGGYVYLSGTSMASPHAAGVVAVLRGLGASREAAERALLESARGPADGRWGRGEIDLAAAVKYYRQGPAPTPTVLPTVIPDGWWAAMCRVTDRGIECVRSP